MKYSIYLAGLFILMTTSCHKDLSYERKTFGVDSLAIFNLATADINCPDIRTSGTYLMGESLTGNEYIQFEVEVTKTGQWEFGTDTLNGFFFSGSGTFTAKGKQEIILRGSGKPVVPGNMIFSLNESSLVFRHSISVLDNHIELENVPAQSYLNVTVGGIDYSYMVPEYGPDDISVGWGGSETTSFSSFIGPPYPNPPGTGTISLQKGEMKNYLSSTEADFKTFLKPGAYPYVNFACRQKSLEGIIIDWNDSDNNVWTTFFLFGDQTGSSFKIVGEEYGYDNKGLYFVKVKMKFNCKLYNYYTGEKKDLINGDMVSYFKRKPI